MPRHEINRPLIGSHPEEFYAYHKVRADLVESAKERLASLELALSELSYGNKGYAGTQAATARTSLKIAQDQRDANLWRSSQTKDAYLDEYIVQARLEMESTSDHRYDDGTMLPIFKEYPENRG